MTIWSIREMSIKEQAFLSLSVKWMSDALGRGSPEGWLCSRMREAASTRRAFLNTVRQSMDVWASGPSEHRDRSKCALEPVMRLVLVRLFGEGLHLDAFHLRYS